MAMEVKRVEMDEEEVGIRGLGKELNSRHTKAQKELAHTPFERHLRGCRTSSLSGTGTARNPESCLWRAQVAEVTVDTALQDEFSQASLDPRATVYNTHTP